MKPIPGFDCVAMKRRGAAALSERVKDMSPEEELEFWRRGTEELHALQQRVREQASSGAGSHSSERGAA